MTLLAPLANFAAQCLHDNRVSEPWTEKRFQGEVQALLRSERSIGAALEVHTQVSRGITDLAFHGVPLELKAETSRSLTLDDCYRYLEQTESYIVGAGKRIGLLCVLDSSPKTSAAMAAEDALALFRQPSGDSELAVIVLLIQANLIRSSDLSRSGAKKP